MLEIMMLHARIPSLCMKTYVPMPNMIALTRLPGLLVLIFLCSGCSTAPSWSTDNDSIEPLLQSSAQALTLANPVDSLYILGDKVEPPVYYVGPNDELLLTIWGSTDLWSEHQVHNGSTQRATVVQPDGTVSLPLLDDVSVSGFSLPQINRLLKNLYTKVIDTPFQIEVVLNKPRSHPITLEGAFNTTGVTYLGTNQQTLGQIISAAGGFAGDADTVNGILTRGQTRYAINYRATQEGQSKLQNLLMQEGDVLFFPSQSERVYYIFGEVVRQGAFPIPSRGISLLEGIARAWGPNVVTGDLEEIYLIRAYSKQQKPSIYELTMDEIMAHEDVALLPGDRIFIPPTGLANWSRTLNQLFGGTAAAGQTIKSFNVEQ